MFKKIKYLFVLTVLFAAGSGSSVKAQTSSYEELQAAYLFNFAKYIKWPGERTKFVIGIYGASEEVNVLKDILASKKVGGKEIELKILTKVEEILDCQIAYISDSGSKEMSNIVRTVANHGILVVTEEDMIRKGAAISFVVEDDKLRFKIKKEALNRAGLVASEGLLKLAIVL